MTQRWSEAMISAWQYAVSAVNEDLSGAEGLRMYRGGGGAIRTQDWYSLMRNAAGAIEGADAIGAMRSDALVPDMAHTTVDQDFGAKYKVKEEFYGYDPTTGQRVRKVVSVLSDEPLPLDQWRDETSSSALAYGVDVAAESVERGRMWFERRMT